MENDIITIKEVADYLRIKEKTAYYLVSKGEIPGFKVGDLKEMKSVIGLKNKVTRTLKNE